MRDFPSFTTADPALVEARKGRLIGVAGLLAASIFAVDSMMTFDGAVAVLYFGVVLLLAPLGRHFVVASSLATMLLATFGFVTGYMSGTADGAASRFGVSLIAIAVATLLSLRDARSRTTLQEQARILELSHDTVIIRDSDDIILYWNDGAEKLYGWSREEALGRACEELLKCDYPASEVRDALAFEGQWSGEITRTRRDGERLVLASRWLRRRDFEGKSIGLIESSSDLTEQRRADTERLTSENRYRAIFDAAGFAAWEADYSQAMRLILDSLPPGESPRTWLLAHPEVARAAIVTALVRSANPAAVELFGAPSSEALIGRNLAGRYIVSPDEIAEILAGLAEGEKVVESELRLRMLDGRAVDIVVRVTLLPEGENWSHVLITAFDVTERNDARARYEQASAELAHAARVSMLGQLAASITHEVNQPLAAIINYGKSAKRWLRNSDPDLEEISGCVEKIINNGTRAAEVVDRVRRLARKAAPQAEITSLAGLIEDSVALIIREARAHDVTVRSRCAPDLQVVTDRIQVQQVLINLLINGIHAMREVVDRPRELCIDAHIVEDMIEVAVADCGTGFPVGGETRLFEPFFTTKADGMGMGLSICRSIIEHQGGRIRAANNPDSGATVAFTLPFDIPRAAETAELIS